MSACFVSNKSEFAAGLLFPYIFIAKFEEIWQRKYYSRFSEVKLAVNGNFHSKTYRRDVFVDILHSGLLKTIETMSVLFSIFLIPFL